LRKGVHNDANPEKKKHQQWWGGTGEKQKDKCKQAQVSHTALLLGKIMEISQKYGIENPLTENSLIPE